MCTFFPRITAPGSPWITMYFTPAWYKPVGAREPGSSKSFIIAAISAGVNWNKHKVKRVRFTISNELTYKNKTQIQRTTLWSSQPIVKENPDFQKLSNTSKWGTHQQYQASRWFLFIFWLTFYLSNMLINQQVHLHHHRKIPRISLSSSSNTLTDQ